MKKAISKILGEEPNQEFIDELGTNVKKIYNNDLKLHHFHLHNYISQQELTFHFMLDKDTTIEKGHDMATAIEKMINENYGMEATIHIEPLTHDAQLVP